MKRIEMRAVGKFAAIAFTMGATIIMSSAEEVLTQENFEQIRMRYEGEWQYPNDLTASNVYAKVKHLYEGDWMRPFDYFLAVRGGGVDKEMETAAFFDFRNFVSNNYEAIASDWRTYETNEMVRFTTLSAIGYTGFDNMTNFADRILSDYEADTNFCSWATIEFVDAPRGTRANIHYLSMNYDKPGISNLIQRIRTLAVAKGDDNIRDGCDYKLSGASKAECLDLIAIGDWWSEE